jgi:MAF protein
MRSLILASSSPYRQKRLTDAGIAFSSISPDIDESAMENEHAEALSLRLATQKAEKVASKYQSGLVVGSDQVASVLLTSGDKRLEKPHTFHKAKQQLLACSGKRVIFYTALCVIDIAAKKQSAFVERVDVQFKTLSESQIDTYLHIDQPLDCAGSFKMEKAGIFLFESIRSNDPNALIGIPMIALAKSLAELGHDIFDFSFVT